MQLLVGLIITCWVSLAFANDITSHSFFSVPAPFMSGSPEKEMLFGLERHDVTEDGKGFSFQAVPLGGASNDPRSLARFLLPFRKSCLVVTEDGSPASNFRDIAASHLNIATINDTFNSVICFKPSWQFAGIGFTYRQRLTCTSQGTTGWWLELSAPVLQVKTSMGLTEQILDDGGGVVNVIGLNNQPRVPNAFTAFKQTGWLFGRINGEQVMVETGIGDIEFKIGLNTVVVDTWYSRSYLGVLFPTGNKPRGRRVFEPIVGSNHHYGILYGTSLGILFWQHKQHRFDLIIDFASRYLFGNCQVRLFDLVDKQWSRYMETYASLAEAQVAEQTGNINSGTSGNNVFVQCVRVHPRFVGFVTSRFSYTGNCWMLEVASSLFARQAELVDINWRKRPALKNVAGLGETTTARTIKDDFACVTVPAENYTPIKSGILNLESAAHPAIVAHILSATLGYKTSKGGFTGIGGSYEFAFTNASMARWQVWGKLGFAF
jgi:hypothetical protein